jgi:hypothetical protein
MSVPMAALHRRGFAASQWRRILDHDSHQGNQDLAILKAVLVEVPLPPAFLSLPVRRYGATGERPLPQEARAGVVPRMARRQSTEGALDWRQGTDAFMNGESVQSCEAKVLL